MIKAGRLHQSFLKLYAEPSKHFSYEEAPVAYMSHEGSKITPDMLEDASTSYNSELSSAAASTKDPLPPHIIDKLIDNPTVRHTSFILMLNNKNINADNLSHAWNYLKEKEAHQLFQIEGLTYSQQKILRHPLVPKSVIDDALTHPHPDVRAYAEYAAKERTPS